MTKDEAIMTLTEELESAANFMRGMTLDQRIPLDARAALRDRVRRIDELTERVASDVQAPTKVRRLRIVSGDTESCGAVARDIDTGEQVNLCYSCGLPRDEHKPNCPKTSDTIFESAAVQTERNEEKNE